MLIKNFDSLASTRVKKKAVKILEAGLIAAQPKNFLKVFVSKNHILLGKNKISLSKYRKIFVIAYGKAADSMAEFVTENINVSKGIVVIKNLRCSILDIHYLIGKV